MLYLTVIITTVGCFLPSTWFLRQAKMKSGSRNHGDKWSLTTWTLLALHPLRNCPTRNTGPRASIRRPQQIWLRLGGLFASAAARPAPPGLLSSHLDRLLPHLGHLPVRSAA